MTPPETIIPPTRTALTGAMALAGAAFAIALVAILLSDTSLTPAMQATAIALGALWALGFGLVARLLFAARSGLLIDRAGARLAFCISSRRDAWWLPLARVAAVRAQAVAAAGQTAIESWICQLVLQNHVHIVIVESGAREFIDHVVTGLVDKLGLAGREGSDADHAPTGYNQGATTLAVTRGGALQGVVTTFGVALVVTGVLAFGQLGVDPIIGFILGPLLLAMGLVLLTTAFIKRFATEHLRHDGYFWHHHYALGRFTWGDRKVRAQTPIWRIVLLGARGAYLELKGEDGSIILGASARATSRASVEALSRIPDAFTRDAGHPDNEAA